MEELKKLLEEQKRAFEEFKRENDKGRGADQAVIAKLQAALDDSEKKLKAQQDEIERKVNRLTAGGAGGEDDGKKAAKESKAALLNFCRKGIERMTPDEQKALVVSNDTTGGIFAPPDFLTDIIKAQVLWSPLREIVNVRSTSRSDVQIPKRTGTAAATWVGETETRVESQNPAWGRVDIPMNELYAEARVTFADLEDSVVDLEAILRDEFAEQFAVSEGKALVNGDGAKKPLGFLDANAAGPSTPITYVPSTQAATIAGAAAGSAGQGDPLVTLLHTLKTAYARNGTWVMNRKSVGAVRKLKDTTGQYLWQPGVGQSGTLAQFAAPTILGAPYVEAPDMPDEGANAFPIAFGDFRRAITLVDRISMSVTRDPFTVANVGQVKLSARRRLGAQVVLGEALLLLKCAVS
jgi:HK97 family phage major capsid protein